MRETRVSLPELGLIAMTRAALGVGIGLLVSERMGGQVRRGVGWALVVTGALSTIPLVADLFLKLKGSSSDTGITNGRPGVKEKPAVGTSAGITTSP